MIFWMFLFLFFSPKSCVSWQCIFPCHIKSPFLWKSHPSPRYLGIILMPSDFLSLLLQLPLPRFLIFFSPWGGGKHGVIVVTYRVGLQHLTLLVGPLQGSLLTCRPHLQPLNMQAVNCSWISLAKYSRTSVQRERERERDSQIIDCTCFQLYLLLPSWSLSWLFQWTLPSCFSLANTFLKIKV